MATSKTTTKTKAVRKRVLKPKPARKPTVTYVRDDQGTPVAVVVPVAFFEELVEAAEQLADLEHLARNDKVPGEPVPWEQVKEELRATGKLR